MDTEHIEGVAASLVREYLSRKGLKKTLDVLDEESPRGENSINNRQQLLRALHIDKLMKKNKESEHPFKSMIEVISLYFVDKAAGRPGSTLERKKSGGSRHQSASSENGHQEDLLLEDTQDGETVLGDRMSGFRGQQRGNSGSRPDSQMSRPKSSAKKAGMAMSGMVTSNVDLDRRKYGRPKPAPSKLASGFQLSSGVQDTSNKLGDLGQDPLSISGRSFGKTDSISAASLSKNNNSSSDSSMFNKDDIPTSRQRYSKNSDSIVGPIVDVLDEGTSNKPIGQSRLARTASQEVENENGLPSYSHSKSSLMNEKVRNLPTNASSAMSKNLYTSPQPQKTQVGDIEFGDVDDLDEDLDDLEIAPRAGSAASSRPHSGNTATMDASPMDLDTAIKLKKLIFGTTTISFCDEWSKQAFTFCDIPKLKYGIRQKKGGPCGVLASVQACMLVELLFKDDSKPTARSLDPRSKERTEALALSLSRIFWRAGGLRSAVVTVPCGRVLFQGAPRLKPDGITEKLMLNNFTSFDSLHGFVLRNISCFENDGNPGVILSLYSVILSRGIDRVISDMDVPTNKLMGLHGYCTQDMVNLYLAGHAASNVFNDVMELDSGGGSDKMILKGINARCDVGLMSLFEHYKSCQVGTYLKTPKYPVWVVCSESHFSVLFSLKMELMSDWRAERRFDLYYYDGLANQDEEYKLTIDTTNRAFEAPSEGDLVSPIDHCIRTKWADAEIDWNGMEPLL